MQNMCFQQINLVVDHAPFIVKFGINERETFNLGN